MEKSEVSSLQNWRSFAKLKEHIFCFLPRMKKLFLIKCLWMKLQLYWRSQFGLRDSSKGISGDAAIFKYRGWIKLQACSKNTNMLGQQVPLRGRVITINITKSVPVLHPRKWAIHQHHDHHQYDTRFLSEAETAEEVPVLREREQEGKGEGPTTPGI